MKWKKLQHNGILFPPEYESIGIRIKINGQNIDLTLDQEEMIYQWSKKKDAPKPGTTEKYIEDPIFQKNFVLDFARTFSGKLKGLKYTDIDFTQPYKLVDKEKEVKELMTKEEKKALAIQRKKIREEMKVSYELLSSMERRSILQTTWLNHQEFLWVEVSIQCVDDSNRV